MNKLNLTILILISLISFLINCTTQINTDRMIEVTNSSEELVETGTGVFDFGNVSLPDSVSEEFTIHNTGSTFLDLTGDLVVEIEDDANGDFSVVEQPKAFLKIGETAKFTIEFTPSQIGDIEAMISILNNDKDFSPYTFKIKGHCGSPEINVRQGSYNIPNANGSFYLSTVSVNDSGGDFVFTIENIGNVELNLTGTEKIELSGTDAAMFMLTQTMTASTIKPGETTTFVISFNPTSFGLKAATITIANNDVDENPYTFTVKGKALAPDINVRQGSNNIESGVGEYDFGRIAVDFSSMDITFLIDNKGNDTLKFPDPLNLIAISGADAAMFFLDQSLTAKSVGPLQYTSFKIAFKPTSPGKKTASVSIANNDPDENPYTFDLVGTGYETYFDFNHDGFDDVLVSAPNYYPGSIGSGAAFIFFGSKTPTSTINASNANVKLLGYNSGSFGSSVSTIGDFNGDGYDDVVVGADYDRRGGLQSGAAYIFFGSSSPSTTINAPDADVILVGEDAEDHFGLSVSSAGDMNNDGYDDVIVGAWLNNVNGQRPGTAYIFYGSPNPASKIDAADADVKLIGENDEDYFGTSVSNAGDVNNDGFDDVIIGALHSDSNGVDSGSTYIFYGNTTLPKIVHAANADVKLVGKSAQEQFGVNVSSAGDFNKDGYDDFIIGAHQNCDSGQWSGCAYLFFGSSNLPSIINTTAADVKITGNATQDYFGSEVSSAGDVNCDGYDDIVIGAPRPHSTKNFAVILLGKSSPASTISASAADVVLYGTDSGDSFGCEASFAGDFNCDGYNDIIVGAYSDSDGGVSSGCAFIFCGKSSMSSSITASDANVKLVGQYSSNKFGHSVSGGR